MAYMNNLEKSQKYLDVVMELFQEGSITTVLDTPSQNFDWMDAELLKVLIVKTTGMGAYEKDVGYPQGAITTTWETLKLKIDRGVKFLLDRIDNDEVLGLTIGRAAQNFTNLNMIPEVDATRFSNYAQGAGNSDSGVTLTNANILEAINDARVTMNNKHVPEAGRFLFVNNKLEGALDKALNRQWSNDDTINTRIRSYNGMEIRYVPETRFYDLITLNTGANNEWGYTKDSAAVDLNFMIVHPSSVVQAAKTANGKFVTADLNQTADSNMFMFRIFHDAFVLDNWKDGVYVNKQ